MATQGWLNEHDRRQEQLRQQHVTNWNTFVKQTTAIDRMPTFSRAPVSTSSYPVKRADEIGSGYLQGHQGGKQAARSEEAMLVLDTVPVVAGVLAGVAVCAMMLVQGGISQWASSLFGGVIAGAATGWFLFREPLQILIGTIVFGIIVPVYKAGRWLVRLVMGHRAIKG